MTTAREIPAADREQAIASLARLLAHHLPGERLVVGIKTWEQARSLEANRYYWQVIVGGLQRCLEAQGQQHTKEAIHEYLKRERWGEDVTVINGRVIYTPRRTRKLSPAQFAEYIDWAAAHVVELGAAEYMESAE